MGINFITTRKTTIGCSWIYTIKFLLDGQIEHLKAWLIAKGYTQTYNDYFETSSLVARMYYICILLSVAVMKHWPLYQLDIKNTFLHEDFQEEVYML